MSATMEVMEAVLPYVKPKETGKRMEKNRKDVLKKEYCILAKKIRVELLKLNCTNEEINQMLTPNVIVQAMRFGYSAEDVAWSLVQ